MDIFANNYTTLNQLLGRREEFDQAFLLQPMLTNFQVQSLVRGMFVSLLNWMHGASIQRTLFACPLLIEHERVQNQTLQLFARFIGHVSEEFLKVALMTGTMNEEDLSSDSLQFKLIFKFGSQLELEKFLSEGKVILRGNEELLIVFDILVELHRVFQSFKGDILYMLDFTKNALTNLAERTRELTKCWQNEYPLSQPAACYGMFPFLDLSCSIFPPKEPILRLEEDLLVHLAAKTIPTLEKFLSTIESLNGTSLFVFFFQAKFHIRFDAFKRIALVNWLKHLYEYHLSSAVGSSLFSFPWPSEVIRVEELHSIVLLLLYFCRNNSWIHRKTRDFASKLVLEPLAKAGVSAERERILRFLFAELYLKRLQVGFQLGLYTNDLERNFAKKLLHVAVAEQKKVLPHCELLQEYWRELCREHELEEREFVVEERVFFQRFHFDLVSRMWQIGFE